MPNITSGQIEAVVRKYLFDPLDAVTSAAIAGDLKIPVEAVHFEGQDLVIRLGTKRVVVTITGETVSVK